MTWFDQCFDKLISHEGGYVNDPRDPGGETMWGVTARVARAPARLLHQQRARRHVPRGQVQLPEALEPARRHVRQVQRRGALALAERQPVDEVHTAALHVDHGWWHRW